MTAPRDRYDADVLVVGAGPVGLAAAIHARAAGLEVLVLDRRDGVLDKACGEGLLPGALRGVQELGVEPAGHPLGGISYRAPGRHADHRFARGPGRGVRRTVLHAALRERAEAAGARLAHGGVRALRQDADGVEAWVDRHDRGAEVLRGRWLLGCDGLSSTVRRLAGLDASAGPAPGPALPRRPGPDARYGLRRHYRLEPWSDLVEVHWAPGAEAYVTPVAADLVGVAVLRSRGVSAGSGAFDETLAATFPELGERLRGAPPAGPVQGAGPLRRRSRRRTAGRVRLVGDASGYVDALTGEGVRVGLAQAASVVRHLDDAAAYEREWWRVTRDYRILTAGLLAWARGPARDAIVPTARALPWLYGGVVERLAR
jgi:flavin-dependent dehydrogenase